ncbi:Uncharacterized protein YigE, DUF2233 family [Cognatiyoonia koreensis]|uniref:Uncharacterized protein YigE, DUF2233 family n=1 Tax=Cognatiyoonia koreensis TaxID=364200 RepID=A0A1I0RWI7_9RHOB|nr:phosphodiester glycosidase family protein [Cognatiyoonia koreensis]SEW45191.1 Uncharacterized protein YigE, DUF2233 family [Cognatiyoonia koreensis]
MRLLVALFMLLATPAAAVLCEDLTFQGNSYTICTVNAATENLRLFHTGQNGEVYGQFDAIQATLDVETLSFAMNAGMYHSDRSPVGLYQEDGAIVSQIVSSDGPGNFGLLPNGVLCINDDSARVIETLQFIESARQCRDATQSGPMLVIDGALHPRFIPNGSSKFIRNGAGTSPDGKTAYFAISNDAVNFHSFGLLFRDYLQVDQALYFDGKVSRLHAPQLGRSDFGFQLGPIIGVID